MLDAARVMEYFEYLLFFVVMDMHVYNNFTLLELLDSSVRLRDWTE